MQTKGLVFGLILFAFLLACGHKAPPLPPERLKPVGVVSVHAVVRSDELLILLKLSDRYENRSKRIRRVALRVYRCDSECGECRKVYYLEGSPGSFTVEDLPPLDVVCYKIEGEADGSVDIPKYLFVVFPKPLPERPVVKVEGLSEGEVELGIEDCSSEGYAVYRRVPPSGYPSVPVFRGVCGKGWVDRDVVEGRTYCYVVRAFDFDRGSFYESDPSDEVCVRPEDVTPPPVPRKVAGVYHRGKVFLSWDPVKAEDLAGYNVYMRVKGGWKKLNSSPILAPSYWVEVEGKGPWTFAVSSVDKKGNESAKSEPVTIRR